MLTDTWGRTSGSTTSAGFTKRSANAPDKLKTVEQGAATTVWAATSPQLDGKGGVYCEDVDIASPTDKGAGAASGVASWATDRDTADRLWAASERWTGAPFTV